MPTDTNLPLAGTRVVDFTQVMLGPCATQMLADLGADVIKVERPVRGDLSRTTFGDEDEKKLNNPVYCSLNRNKRSVALDLRSEKGRESVYALVRKADVVVNNFRPGVMERLGFGYNDLNAINERIIYACGTGFGLTGPYAHKGGQDVLAQAMTGVMERRADPALPRSIYPTTLCDYTAAMHLVQGILSALLAREATGRGQHVSVSLYDSMLAMQMQEAAVWLLEGQELNWANLPLTGAFDTEDGALVLVGAFKANPLRDICRALDIEDLSKDFPDLDTQKRHKKRIQGRFQERFRENTTAYWIARLEEQDLLCAPVRTLGEALEDEQTKTNGMICTVDHPIHGTMSFVASPIHFSDVPFVVRRAPPRLGEDTEDVIAELAEDGPEPVAGGAWSSS